MKDWMVALGIFIAMLLLYFINNNEQKQLYAIVDLICAIIWFFIFLDDFF